MNNLQRRIFRTFVRLGGDPTDAAAVEELIRHLEATLVILPPRIGAALQVAWRNAPNANVRVAERLSKAEGRAVSATAVRQRVSRGARLLEQAMRRRGWRRSRVGGARPRERARGRQGSSALSRR